MVFIPPERSRYSCWLSSLIQAYRRRRLEDYIFRARSTRRNSSRLIFPRRVSLRS